MRLLFSAVIEVFNELLSGMVQAPFALLEE
jgi:hypothetical protein